MTHSSRFIDACYRRPTDCTPVWLMRQAGRYQRSYQQLRKRLSFVEMCSTPDVAAEITINAVQELGVDAAIIFSDILFLLEAMGVGLRIDDGGPTIDPPARTAADVHRLRVVDPREALPRVMEAIRVTRGQLDRGTPLIGFAGGPITLAAYLVGGTHSRGNLELKRMLFAAPDVAHLLLDKLAQMIAEHLRAQIEAGCQAVQVFDSWVGDLGPYEYDKFALPYTQRIFSALADCGVPRILFGTSTAGLLHAMQAVDAEVISLDWRVDLGAAWADVGHHRAVQGNLDPAWLLADEPALESAIGDVLAAASGRPGHIFNLGHGVLRQTPEERVRFLVDTVHRLSTKTTTSPAIAAVRG